MEQAFVAWTRNSYITALNFLEQESGPSHLRRVNIHRELLLPVQKQPQTLFLRAGHTALAGGGTQQHCLWTLSKGMKS